jgi:hypothetical protein
MKRLILPVLALALAAAACSSSDTAAETTVAPTTTAPVTTTEATATTIKLPPTTTTTLSPEEIAQAELEVDTKLIKSLWRDLSDSWFDVEQGVAFLADNNYPALECTLETTTDRMNNLENGYSEEHIVDAASIERDDGWTMNGGPSNGEPIDGRIYIFTVDMTFSGTYALSTNERAEVHTTIHNGKAYFFFHCWNAALDG